MHDVVQCIKSKPPICRRAHGNGIPNSTNLVALTLAGVWRADNVLPPITPYYVMKVGHVPLIADRRPGAPEVAQEVAALAATVRAVVQERLGPVVWEKSVSQASFVLEELEETAALWMSTGRTASPLSDDVIEELRHIFGARWSCR